MTETHVDNPGSSSRVGVSWSDGSVSLRDPELFAQSVAERCVPFLRRVFALDEVAHVELDRNNQSATIRYESAKQGLPDFLARLAAALRDPLPAAVRAPSRFFARDLCAEDPRLKIQRFGMTLTTWDVVVDRPGRARLRHASLRMSPAAARRVEGALERVAGINEFAVWGVTGSVLVRFDPEVISAVELLRVLDQARHAPDTNEVVPRSSLPSGFALANSSLALAVTGELVAPILLPACALVLLGSNLRTFRVAGQQLMRGQVGLPVLYSTIVAATLATGQFVASAAMSWMFAFWNRRYKNDLARARRRLVGQVIHQPRYVRLAISGSSAVDIEIAIEDLSTGDVISIAAGELIPADGAIVEGRGLADERLVRGIAGLTRKQPGDEVFAGSTLLLGRVQVEVGRCGAQTRLASLAQITLDATTVPHGSRTPSAHGEAFAEHAVAPTMAAAGLGLLVGDLATAGAILRPDYASGPGIAFPLETLQAIALCLRHGIVVREPAALMRLSDVDLVLVDCPSAIERTELDVDHVQVFPGYDETDILKYAATAFRDLDDQRATAMLADCRARRIPILDVAPSEFESDLTLVHGADRIKVGDLGTRARGHGRPSDQTAQRSDRGDRPNSLMVGINGQVAGLVHFRCTDRLEATSALRRLCTKRNISLGVVSDRSTFNAARLGADFQVGILSLEDRVRFLEDCRNRGLKVAFVGVGNLDARTVAEAHVAISLAPSDSPADFTANLAPIHFIHPRMTRLGELWDIASIHRRRIRIAQAYAMIPNIACVAGAFAWGFTSLASVLLTNIGTYCLYTRTSASIRTLERHIADSLSIARKPPGPVTADTPCEATTGA